MRGYYFWDEPNRAEISDSWQPSVSIIQCEGPNRLSDDGTGTEDLPSTADFIGFAEGHA